LGDLQSKFAGCGYRWKIKNSANMKEIQFKMSSFECSVSTYINEVFQSRMGIQFLEDTNKIYSSYKNRFYELDLSEEIDKAEI
jgi:hypothetical protein